MDEESLSDQEIDSTTRTVEAALRGLPEGACLTQFSLVRSGYEIPRKSSYGNPVLESFVSDRLEYLNANAGFRRIELFWCLTFEPSQSESSEAQAQRGSGRTTRRICSLAEGSQHS